MKTLFDISLFNKKTRKEKCKNCVFFTWIDYSPKKIFYCNLRVSNRTENGKLKIKANRTACDQFTEPIKPTLTKAEFVKMEMEFEKAHVPPNKRVI